MEIYETSCVPCVGERVHVKHLFASHSTRVRPAFRVPRRRSEVGLTSAVHLQNGASLLHGAPSRWSPFWQVQQLVSRHPSFPYFFAIHLTFLTIASTDS
jgi:hypothetical protein